jgi:pyridoxal phosphate enzyme (YggS family)
LIAERVAEIRERVARAAARANRSPEEVTLVAVSKLKPADDIRQAFEAGVRDFGENRVQEAERKRGELGQLPGVSWHLVGHLQSNKAAKAVSCFDRIHSLDGTGLGHRLDKAGREQGRPVRALLQVDLAGEETKFGVPEDSADAVLDELRECEGLRLEGLMLLPPYDPDPERVRPFFRRLRELRDRARDAGRLAGGELSMGMSHDFEVAIEEGATLIRVGTALFGERPGRH